MRIINLKRQKASKHVEHNSEGLKNHSVAATSTPEVSMSDESQRSAINPKSWLHLLKMRIINREPRSAFVTTKHEKEQQKSKRSKSSLKSRLFRLLSYRDWQHERDHFRTLSKSSELNIESQSYINALQLPTCNSGVVNALNNQRPDDFRKRDSLQFELGDNLVFRPTSYPLMRSNVRNGRYSSCGIMNLAASGKLLNEPLKKIDKVCDKRPNFRLGPRPQDNGAKVGVRVLVNSSDATQQSIALDTAPKYCFIFQNGKLVEREVRPWPYLKQPKLTLRYKICEPYASNYGKRFVERAQYLQKRAMPASTRRIYDKPIFRLPRAIFNDNKRRLLARHALKTFKEPEPGAPCRGPVKVNMLEGEQCKRYREFEKHKFVGEAINLIAYHEKGQDKAASDS